MRNRSEGVEKYIIYIKSGSLLKEVSVEFLRHLSPITIERLYRNLPLQGMVVRDNDLIYISAPIDTRLEKPRNRLRRGHVAYSPSKKMIMIALEDVRLNESVNSLGRVVEGLEELEKLRTGHMVRLERE
ncbi:MAG: cyclophilin-like family protein [Candidatus Korarchaeota archaeon]|nr:cyclophilin-like family protein [Candidatus Korarchaeota archaeon]